MPVTKKLPLAINIIRSMSSHSLHMNDGNARDSKIADAPKDHRA